MLMKSGKRTSLVVASAHMSQCGCDDTYALLRSLNSKLAQKPPKRISSSQSMALDAASSICPVAAYCGCSFARSEERRVGKGCVSRCRPTNYQLNDGVS